MREAEDGRRHRCDGVTVTDDDDPAPDLLLARDHAGDGRDDRHLARACATGALVRVGVGAYVPDANWQARDPRARQLVRVVAAHRSRRPAARGRVVSHESAALSWGLPTWGWPARRVELTDPGSTTTRSGSVLVHAGPLEQQEIVERPDGLIVTSLRRTVLDLLVSRTREQAVVLVDHLLGRGWTRGELEALLAVRPTARNRRRAAWAVAFGDAGGATPGESVSRVLAHEAGFVAPELQRRFCDAEGFVGVVDFFFPTGDGRGVVGEFDGSVKYLDEAHRSGRVASEVVLDEKEREDRLRALPTTSAFVRWGRRQVAQPHLLAARLRTAGVPRRDVVRDTEKGT